jgi:hypothetical protein
MLVMLDEPKNEKWGSEAAAPIFSAVGHEILRYLEVPARDAQPVQFMANEKAVDAAAAGVVSASAALAPDLSRMPDVLGQPLRQALATLAVLRADVELHGNGLVIQQIPAAGESVPEHGPIRLTLARPRDFK